MELRTKINSILISIFQLISGSYKKRPQNLPEILKLVKKMPIVGTYVSLNIVFFEVVHAMKHIVVPTGEH